MYFTGKEFRALVISAVRTRQDIVDDGTNFGFLSDPKLMNTAISRAADFVAVVGEPLALCTTGSCRKFWYSYIEVCSRNGGLFPETVSMDWIHLQLKQFDTVVSTYRKDLQDISPDEILKELAKQAAGTPSAPFTIEIDEGYGVLGIAEASSNDIGESAKNRSADDVSGDRENLLSLVKEQPERYVQCRLAVVAEDTFRADFIDEIVRHNMSLKGIQCVEIKGRANCERAFPSDEVVVELLACDSNRASGKVCVVLRECIDRKKMKIVCAADKITCTQGTVKPLDPSLPCFRTLISKKDSDRAKRQGFISVYKLHGAQPVFFKFVKINPDRANNMLLVVRYLKWKQGSSYPLGVVVDEIPLGYDFDSAIKLVAINCQIRQHFPANSLAEVDVALRHLAGISCETFKDFTDVRVFTIDGDKAKDLDDALSLVMLDGEICRVGIHIIDVAYFIEKGSCIDTEAFERLETFYRDNADDPLVPMLPHRLSTDICSLLPDRQRPVLSFWYKVKLATGEVVDEHVKRSLVKSCKKFTYQEVDDVLNGKPKSSSQFDDELCRLFDVAKAWSKQRGSRCFTAKNMVAELMFKANDTALSMIMDKFPDCVPLYVNQTLDVVHVQQEQVPSDGTFKQAAAHSSQIDSNEKFLLLKPVWWKIIEEVASRNFTDVRALLLDADKHGQELCNQLDWNDDDSQRVYRCSGSVVDITSEKKYMRVTSPIRRYMDLVSLRILIVVLEGQEDCPYTKEEMDQLCQHANDGILQKNKFQHEIRVLRRAVELKGRAAVKYPYVSSLNNSALSLRFPSVSCNKPELQDLKYNGLDLVKNPEVQTSVKFSWQQRIYDLQHPNAVQTSANANEEISLPSGNERYCFSLPTSEWKSIIDMAEFSNVRELDQQLKSVQEYIISKMCQTDLSSDRAVTAEVFNRPDEDFREHFVRMSLDVQPGSFTQVQLSADVKNGMLQPSVQLFCLTSKSDICVEHREEALRCFSSKFAEPASQAVYKHVEKYQQAWLPIVSMEAANSAVEEGGASICGARVKWWKEGKQIRGRIQLETDYCKRRQLSFYPMNARYFHEDYKLLPQEKKPMISRGRPNEFDYLCIRYTGSVNNEIQDMFSGKFPLEQHRTDSESNHRKTYAEVVKMPPPAGISSYYRKPMPRQSMAPKSPSWVGHGITTYISKFSRKNKPPLRGSTKMINVHFKLHQHSSDFPTTLLSKGLYIDCTVEWLPKLTPHQ